LSCAASQLTFACTGTHVECAKLLNELNELRPEADGTLRQQIWDLEMYLLRTNRQGGIGFRAMGVTLNTKLLAQIMATLVG
jgi:hypothetical protein